MDHKSLKKSCFWTQMYVFVNDFILFLLRKICHFLITRFLKVKSAAGCVLSVHTHYLFNTITTNFFVYKLCNRCSPMALLPEPLWRHTSPSATRSTATLARSHHSILKFLWFWKWFCTIVDDVDAFIFGGFNWSVVYSDIGRVTCLWRKLTH